MWILTTFLTLITSPPSYNYHSSLLNLSFIHGCIDGHIYPDKLYRCSYSLSIWLWILFWKALLPFSFLIFWLFSHQKILPSRSSKSSVRVKRIFSYSLIILIYYLTSTFYRSLLVSLISFKWLVCKSLKIFFPFWAVLLLGELSKHNNHWLFNKLTA